MAHDKKVYGGSKTQKDFSISDFIQSMAYMSNMSNQMTMRDERRSAVWQGQTMSYMKDFTPQGGITSMTDKVALDRLHNNLIAMDNKNKEGPYGSDWEADKSRDYHVAAMEAVSHQVGLINKVEGDFKELTESNDRMYISGPQTSNDVNYDNLLSEDGKLLFPEAWVKQDGEGHNYIESTRFFETYLDVVNTRDTEGNSGATTKIGQTMHQILLNSHANTKTLLQRWEGNGEYASLISLPEFSHMNTTSKSVDAIMDYGDSILGNILYSHGDESVVDPEFAMFYHNAVEQDDFSETSQLNMYKKTKIVRDLENQKSFKQGLDNKHIAYLSYKSILDLTGEKKIIDGVTHYMVPDIKNQKKGEMPQYFPMTEIQINANIGPTVSNLYNAILEDQEIYNERWNHRYDKILPRDVNPALLEKLGIKVNRASAELEKREEEVVEPKTKKSREYNEKQKSHSISMWVNEVISKQPSYGYKEDVGDVPKLLAAYNKFIDTNQGKIFLKKNYERFNPGGELSESQQHYKAIYEGMEPYLWLKTLSDKELSKILNRNLTK